MLRKLTLFKHTDSVQTFDCRHEIYSSVLFVKRFYILSTKQHKKAKEKNLSSIIEQDALSGIAWKMKCLYDYIPNVTGQNDRQDRSLTGQVPDQAGHCLFTRRYFQP